MKYLFAALACWSLSAAAAIAAPPDWFLEEISRLTADGGRWIADNSAYKSADEPFEAYGIQWDSGFDGVTMTGRLFGLKDGVETANFWEFRQFWHFGRNEGVLEQIGWGGVYGVGVVSQDDGDTVTDQTFYRPDGSSARQGHRSRFPDPDTHATDSFNIIDGEWRPERSYIWKKQAAKK